LLVDSVENPQCLFALCFWRLYTDEQTPLKNVFTNKTSMYYTKQHQSNSYAVSKTCGEELISAHTCQDLRLSKVSLQVIVFCIVVLFVLRKYNKGSYELAAPVCGVEVISV
jgi:hypothetical protein